MPPERAAASSGLTRRAFTAGVAGLGLGAVVPAASAAAATPAGARGRAEASWAALQRYFRVDDGSGLYREQHPVQAGDHPYSSEWPFSQAHVAALDLTGMAGAGRRHDAALAAHVRAQRHYRVAKGTTGLPGYASSPPPPYGAQAGDIFYDDNEWVGLKDVQQHSTPPRTAAPTATRWRPGPTTSGATSGTLRPASSTSTSPRARPR